ncbi:MAG TPA: type II secretion system protein [Terriglobia bacterium]|nr:type II secretion system protein [Terriglobia bacterium]
MKRERTGGFTLVELIVTIALVSILVGLALPLARNTIQREREKELRAALRTMREAIDRYKVAADGGQIMADAMANGYPPDLETLANGVDLLTAVGKKIYFLRAVPIDPMSECRCNTDWDLRSDQDDPTAGSWGGQDVFDVHTKSSGTAMDGTKYKDW